ncbi:MAG TPA: hypothetical protein PKA82_05720 [Pyrinomonadaceae bacterium]|nr:hypothetical protein [Pyrinomonadaceae bacterium]
MNLRVVTVGIIAALAGATAGFVLANSLNRTTINALKAQIDNRQSSPQTTAPGQGDLGVSDEEIKAKIQEADSNPTDVAFQKNLGRGLYRFAAMKRDPILIEEAKRILERAKSLDPKDFDVLVDLGNAYFDIGYFKKDAAAFKSSRESYEAAMVIKPTDANVRTEYALTFYLSEPADLKRAHEEFAKALKLDPKQERALQFTTSAYIREGDFVNATKTIEMLKSVNPKNDSIPSLQTQIDTKTYTPTQ